MEDGAIVRQIPAKRLEQLPFEFIVDDGEVKGRGNRFLESLKRGNEIPQRARVGGLEGEGLLLAKERSIFQQIRPSGGDILDELINDHDVGIGDRDGKVAGDVMAKRRGGAVVERLAASPEEIRETIHVNGQAALEEDVLGHFLGTAVIVIPFRLD